MQVTEKVYRPHFKGSAKEQLIYLCSKKTRVHGGPLQNPRLCIWHDSLSGVSGYYWEVFYEVVASDNYTCPCDITTYMDQLLPSSGFVVCPGIKEYPEQIRFKTKHLIEWDRPFPRKCSDSCSLWFLPKSDQQQFCAACHKLEHDIKYLAKRADSTTDSQKLSRTLPSSKCPISNLSPVSQMKRFSKTAAERKQLISKVKHLELFECEVSDKQHEELLKLVKSVKDSKVIQELIAEGQ